MWPKTASPGALLTPPRRRRPGRRRVTLGENLTRKILRHRLVDGRMDPGEEVAVGVDQTLLQDATGTVAWLEFEQVGVDRVRVRQATQYVDHNILQTGFENADDHLFLQSCAARFGAVFSKPGTGISHWVALEQFDRPGETMVGADSHTPEAGAVGMLAIGAGGFEVAAAMAGEPYRVRMPEVVNVHLAGELPPWTSAKDVILHLLKERTVKGGLGKVLEYTGPALAHLSVPERATIANMGAELGATSSIFPSDERTEHWFQSQSRAVEYQPMGPDEDATYDGRWEVDLSTLEPLIAKPYSPDAVVPVREVAGVEAFQAAVGSSVNSGFRDLSIAAEMLDGRVIAPHLSMAVSPGSRQVLVTVMTSGALTKLIRAGVRELEVACGPCIGMGFAPPTHGPSVRSFNRNFKGRSSTEDDLVYLASPETVTATALKGAIADPRDVASELGLTWRTIPEPDQWYIDTSGFVPPPGDGANVPIRRGPNIPALPAPTRPGRSVEGVVLLKLGDNVSTDDILPAGAKILPLRSNIPAIAEHTFEYVDATFPTRARAAGTGVIVGGENYGQGSSREHAALAPMFLGVRLVVAKSFARIHQDNLVNAAIPPLRFARAADYDRVRQGDRLRADNILGQLERGQPVLVRDETQGFEFETRANLTSRQRAILSAGGGVAYLRGHARPSAPPP